jgi:ring-1,2-phenylacetyl-CoA epoxidase subunit PaaC
MSTVVTNEITKAAELPEPVRGAVRDLILILADSKRLLGMRYANWILGAPELEAGIACASMAQDEWGHGRLLYALLRDFGDDVDALEHGREPAGYRNIEVLDAEPDSWIDLVVINVFVDTALTLQLEALTSSAYVPLRQRVQKLLEEEAFHTAHGVAWFRRLADGGAATCALLRESVANVAPVVMRWFGADTEESRALQDASITTSAGSDLRRRFATRVAPQIRLLDDAAGFTSLEPDFANFQEASRRTSGTAPDARTIAQVRGDLNRAFLMD